MKLCLVALRALPVFEPSVRESFGGLETHAWQLAQGFARRPGFAVTFVVKHDRPLPRAGYDRVAVLVRPASFVDRTLRSFFERVRVERTFPYLRPRRWDADLVWQFPVAVGWRLLRRWRTDPRRPHPSYRATFREVGADAVLCFGANAAAATAIASAKADGRPTLLFLESDSDLDPRHTPGSRYVDPYGERGDVCAFVLREADAIIAQTDRQRRLLAKRFGRLSTVVVNPFDAADWDARTPATHDPGRSAGLSRYVLWIGRTDEFHKRPRLLFEVAHRCPEVDFLMVLEVSNPELATALAAERPPNVRVVGPVPFGEMPALFRGAAVYVSTGSIDFEGSPNVFVQAAASGVPVASLEVDPGFVAAADCGCVAGGDVDRLAEYVHRVWADDALARRHGGNGQAHVRDRHRLEAVVGRIEGLLRGLPNEVGSMPSAASRKPELSPDP